jgi:hypothetical protein
MSSLDGSYPSCQVNSLGSNLGNTKITISKLFIFVEIQITNTTSGEK